MLLLVMINYSTLICPISCSLLLFLCYITHQSFHRCEQLRFEFDEDNEDVKFVIASIFKELLRQHRYKLKATYFTGQITANVRTKSHAPCMTDEQWGDLVKHWSDPKNVVWLMRTVKPD